MKKKFLATALGLTLALASTTAAFASTTIGPDTSGKPDPSTAGMAVTYEVAPTYTVTIPAEVAIGSAATVEAENVVLEEGKALYVTISATSENNELLIRSSDGKGTETLKYTVTGSGSASYAVGDTILTVDPASANSGSIALNFALASGETASYSGIYSGTMTFTISLDDAA